MLQDSAIEEVNPVNAQPSPGAHAAAAAQPSSGMSQSPSYLPTVPTLNPEAGPVDDLYPDDASGLTLSEDAPPKMEHAEQTREDTAESDIGEFGSVLCHGSSDVLFAQHTTCASHPAYASESACLPASFELPCTEELGFDEDPPDSCWNPPKHPTAPLPENSSKKTCALKDR